MQKVLMDGVQKRDFVEALLKMKASLYPAKTPGIFLIYHLNKMILIAYSTYIMRYLQ